MWQLPGPLNADGLPARRLCAMENGAATVNAAVCVAAKLKRALLGAAVEKACQTTRTAC